jgi:uncharacterized protein YbjQ (UPF0145 family)
LHAGSAGGYPSDYTVSFESINSPGNVMNRYSSASLRTFGGCVLAAAMLALSACSSAPKQAGNASQVQVYRSMQLTPTRYTTVKRIWIDDLRSNFTYPTFDDEQAGIDAMKREAARVGANGIMNVICLDPSSGKAKGGLLCYGDAVKVN